LEINFHIMNQHFRATSAAGSLRETLRENPRESMDIRSKLLVWKLIYVGKYIYTQCSRSESAAGFINTMKKHLKIIWKIRNDY